MRLIGVDNKYMKVIAGVVLFNPQKENIIWIKTLVEGKIFDKFIIFDNSTTSHENLFDDTKIQYIFNGSNDGLSKPYNIMIDLALDDSADFLCLLDQDSDYSITEINNMILFLQTEPSDLNDAIIGAPRSYVITSKRVNRREQLTTVDFAINSGSFLQLKLIRNTGLRYDEQVFLDGVDYEFGWQISKAGFKTKIYENSILEQNLGYCNEQDNRFTHHAAFRYFLIAKNRKYIYRKHKGLCKGFLIASLKNIYLCGKIIIYEDEKWAKLVSCVKGMLS